MQKPKGNSKSVQVRGKARPGRAQAVDARAKARKARTAEIETLRRRLEEAEDTLRAITSGEVDALVVSGPHGDQLYTLKDADRAYRQLVEQLAEGACTLDAQGIIYFANSYLVRLLGVPLEQVLGQSMLRWVWTPDRDRFQALLQQALESDAKGELSLVSAERNPLPVQLSLSPLDAEQGPCISVVLFDLRDRKQNEQALRDMNRHLERRVKERTAELETTNTHLHDANEELEVTIEELRIANEELAKLNQRLQAEIAERHFAEEALRESEQRARDLIRYAPTSIYEIDFRGPRFTRVNDAMCYMSGYSRDELLAMNPFDLMDEDSRKRFQSRIQATLANEPVDESVEYMVKSKDGREIVAVLKTQLMREAGKPIGAFVIAHDITEHKRAEERINALNRDLERRSTELAGTNRELESFTYSVSHDLRTPLTSIENFARLAFDDYATRLPEEGQKILKLIEANARETNRLVEDLLRFSRTTRLPLNREIVDMREIVLQVLDELGARQVERPLELVVGDLAEALVDPVLIKQVWTNLLSNALKYTRKRAVPRIEIGCGPCDGAEVVYYVRDNGVGFDMAQADKLFGVFQRLHLEDEYEGTGVGLAIVERIIRRHGGHVWAEAEVDKGATFYFTIGN